MGRRTTNTVDYFPHIAKQGKTLFILKNRFGNNGYAFWFQLLECLCLAEGHFYDCRDEEAWQYLLSITGLDDQTTVEILALLAKLQKIDRELWGHKVIWCQKLVENLASVYNNRKRSPPAKPSISTLSGGITTVEMNPVVKELEISTPKMPQSKVEYSKEEKEISTVDNSPRLVHPNLIQGRNGHQPLWEKLRDAFPKKVDVKFAEPVFYSLLDSGVLTVESFETMILPSIEALKVSSRWKEKNGRFIPRLEKWLDNEGWKEGIELIAKQKGNDEWLVR